MAAVEAAAVEAKTAAAATASARAAACRARGSRGGAAPSHPRRRAVGRAEREGDAALRRVDGEDDGAQRVRAARVGRARAGRARARTMRAYKGGRGRGSPFRPPTPCAHLLSSSSFVYSSALPSSSSASCTRRAAGGVSAQSLRKACADAGRSCVCTATRAQITIGIACAKCTLCSSMQTARW